MRVPHAWVMMLTWRWCRFQISRPTREQDFSALCQTWWDLHLLQPLLNSSHAHTHHICVSVFIISGCGLSASPGEGGERGVASVLFISPVEKSERPLLLWRRCVLSIVPVNPSKGGMASFLFCMLFAVYDLWRRWKGVAFVTVSASQSYEGGVAFVSVIPSKKEAWLLYCQKYEIL